jgi:inner membrane protein
MMGKTHQAFAVLCLLVVERTTPDFLESSLMSVGLVMVGALLPDLDSPESSYGRLCPWLSKPLHSVLGHRTLTHSLFMVAAIYFLSLQPGVWHFMVPPLLVGYCSHILGDLLICSSGVGLFWPGSWRITLNPFGLKVGGMAEYFLLHLIVIAVCVLIFARSEPMLYQRLTHQLIGFLIHVSAQIS